jgi:hypothetical protein
MEIPRVTVGITGICIYEFGNCVEVVCTLICSR